MMKLISLLLIFVTGVISLENANYSTETNITYDPCCSFPCQNGGICTQKTLHSYECDCTSLGYYGNECHTPFFSTKWDEFWTFPFKYKETFLCGDGFIWLVINHVKSLHRNTMEDFYDAGSKNTDMPTRYNVKYDYITSDSHFETYPIARLLPQVPVNCPTPMGVLGPKLLPDEDELYEKVFRRRRFKPDPFGTNLLTLTFTEYLSYMLFKTDTPEGYTFSKLPTGFDSDHLYGKDEATRKELRTMVGGKLKTSYINGEIFPPLLSKDVPAPVEKPKGAPPDNSNTDDPDEEDMCSKEIPVPAEMVGTDEVEVRGCTADVDMDYPPETEGLKFALGHPKLARTPFLIVFSTILIREHNRVAYILAIEHPDWDDERIYQVSRLIVTGELIHITMSDYITQVTQYNLDLVWDPKIFNREKSYEVSRMNVELQQLKHWYAMYPDCLKIGNVTYNYTETYYNNKILTRVGFDTVTDILVRNPAGKITFRNYGELTRHEIIKIIQDGRKYRLQSLNNYRKHYGLEPYRTMFDLCGERRLSEDLERFYGDINAVEFIVGMAAEKFRCSVFSPTQMAIGGPYVMKSILSHPINSLGWWKPSTFGGATGYKIVKTATLKGLFCLNRMNPCKGEELISFHVPTKAELEAEAARKRARLWCLDDDEIKMDP